MAKYNLYTLLHRTYSWTVTLPNGIVQSGVEVREIPVRIPKIQRDYAEGRNTEMIERKRHNLLNDMLDVIYGYRKALSFDFIYGYMINNGETISEGWQDAGKYPNIAFEPLDGQQRLTTLFLLYWLFNRGEELRTEATEHSLFIYETRDTSEEFCHWLVRQKASCIIRSWQKEVSNTEEQNKINKSRWKTEKNASGIVDPVSNRLRFPLIPVPSLFNYMQSIDSFKWDWHNDPNIYSMIKVLESTVKYLQERGLDYQDGINRKANLDNITFMLLDNLVCDGDQLFEKMNARGKALTCFEILKSSLEEEMERQGLPMNLANSWREAIDGNWIDYCWNNSNIGNNPQLKTVRDVERKLERLLVRMAGKSFFTTEITGTPKRNDDAIDYAARLVASISKREYVNDVIDCYIEYARHERTIGNTGFAVLDFQSIYNDIQSLIYKDSAGWRDASYMLPQLNQNNDLTLLDEFTSDSPTHNTRVMVYAMFGYLRIVPAKNIAANLIEKNNFIDWMRFIRNVYNSDNKNSGLDNFADVKAAIKAIDHWLDKYKNSYRTNNSQDILRLIFYHIKNNAYSQEQARLDEESIKADLRINGSNGVAAIDWESSILKAENNYYLWGQIIAPLSWAYNGTFYDKTLFDSYILCLDRIFHNPLPEDKPIDALLIQAMLCYQDYRHNLNRGLGSLGRLNNNRDYSWKQYLRKQDSATGYYGSLFKTLIDKWLLPTNISLSFEDLLKREITLNKSKYKKADWQYYIVNISDPQSLLNLFGHIRTYGRYVYSDPNGHTYYFRSNTFRTYYRYELLTTYLSYETGLLVEGVKSTDSAHTVDDFGAHVDFTKPNGDIVRLSLGENNLYNIGLQSSGSDDMRLLYKNIEISLVEIELKKLNVILSF